MNAYAFLGVFGGEDQGCGEAVVGGGVAGGDGLSIRCGEV